MKKFRRRSARMNLMHYRVLVARYFRQIFSSLGTLLPLVLQAPVMLVIVWLVSRKDAFTLKSPDALTGANVTLFMLVIMSALMGILNSYREICKERDILSREVFGGLDITAYVLSKVTVLSVVGIVQCAVLFGGTLIFIDFAFPFPATGYVCCYAAMGLTNISVMTVGLFISALLKKSESAILPVLFIIIVQVVFCDSLFSLEGAAGAVLSGCGARASALFLRAAAGGCHRDLDEQRHDGAAEKSRPVSEIVQKVVRVNGKGYMGSAAAETHGKVDERQHSAAEDEVGLVAPRSSEGEQVVDDDIGIERIVDARIATEAHAAVCRCADTPLKHGNGQHKPQKTEAARLSLQIQPRYKKAEHVQQNVLPCPVIEIVEETPPDTPEIKGIFPADGAVPE